MQIGNPRELDAAREALRDAFDAIWIASTKFGRKETRAVRCATALDCQHYRSPNWIIFPGGRACGASWNVIRG